MDRALTGLEKRHARLRVEFWCSAQQISALPLRGTTSITYIKIYPALRLIDELTFDQLAVYHLANIQSTDCGVVVCVRHYALIIAQVVQRADQRRIVGRVAVKISLDYHDRLEPAPSSYTGGIRHHHRHCCWRILATRRQKCSAVLCFLESQYQKNRRFASFAILSLAKRS
jgi:hypothetical protein